MIFEPISIAEYEKLKADTAEDRMIVNRCFPCQIMQRIEKLIEYYSRNRIDTIMICIALYHIGFVDGKRTVRTHRIAKTAHAGEEATV